MIIHYGYEDASGEYFISVDSDKCNACSKCVEVCPWGVLEMRNITIDLEELLVAAVTEEHRKKIKYSCAPCNPEKKPPCVLACEQGAIIHTWKPVRR
ncbi:MAG: 4Fe-4S binding protein [Candidatus Bathyarchaeia archaeon]